jgi:DNA-binding NarL/FixJ family response regulator
LIADDHPAVRRSLKELVEDTGLIAVVAEASDGIEALDIVRRTALDLVLLDLNMPRKGGLETLIELKREHPSLPVLIISGHCVQHYAPRLVKLGAAGFISKEDAPDHLVKTIHSAMAEASGITFQR